VKYKEEGQETDYDILGGHLNRHERERWMLINKLTRWEAFGFTLVLN